MGRKGVGKLAPFGVAFVQETTVFREFGPLAGNTMRLAFDIAPKIGNTLSRRTLDGDARHYLRLGGSGVFACLCPTTERDLGDGLAPARPLAAAGCALTLGSDSHAVIDILEEARGVEYCERLARRSRGHFTAESLLQAATAAGHASLGWPDAGEIAPGALADLVTVSLDSLRTAGAPDDLALETAVFAASAADIRTVVIGGRDVVRDGVHLLVRDVPGELARTIRAVSGLAPAASSAGRG